MRRSGILTVIIVAMLLCIMSACGCSCNSNKGDNKTTTYSFNISKTSMDLDVGASEKLNCTYGNETIIFESSDEKVATVDDSGVVTGVSEGEAYITAKAKNVDGAEKICKVTVTKVEYSVTLDRTGEINVIKGSRLEFTAMVYKNGTKTDKFATFSVNPSLSVSQTKNVAIVKFDTAGEYEVFAEYSGAKTSVKVIVTESVD